MIILHGHIEQAFEKFNTICRHAIQDSSPAPVDEFGPNHGSLYTNASKAEKANVAFVHLQYQKQQISDFKKFIQTTTSRQLKTSLMMLHNDEKECLFMDFINTVQAQRFTNFLVGSQRTYEKEEIYELLLVSGFTPGLAMFCIKDWLRFHKKILKVFKQTFEAGGINREQFLSLSDEQKRAWCHVWGDTLHAHLTPLGDYPGLRERV